MQRSRNLLKFFPCKRQHHLSQVRESERICVCLTGFLEEHLLEVTDPVSCSAEGDGIRVAQPGVTAMFSIISRDATGRRRNTGGDSVKVSIRGPSTPEATVKDNGDGTYSVSYIPDSLGAHQVDVLVHDCPIDGSPFEVSVAPSTCFSLRVTLLEVNIVSFLGDLAAGSCRAEGDGLKYAFAGRDTSFVIYANSQLGKRMPARVSDFSVTIEGETLALEPATIPVTVSVEGPGTLRASYKAEKRGNFVVTVLCRGVPIADSPFNLRVGSGTRSSASVNFRTSVWLF